MKNFIIVLIAVGAIALAWFFAKSNKSLNSEQTQTPINQSQSSGGATDNQTTTTTTSQGSYENYSANIISATEGTKILFFHAPWCPQCRALESSINAGKIPSGVTIIKVDYDSSQSLRKKYGVTIQTTLVRVDDDGNLVEKFVAYESPTLQSVIDNLL